MCCDVTRLGGQNWCHTLFRRDRFTKPLSVDTVALVAPGYLPTSEAPQHPQQTQTRPQMLTIQSCHSSHDRYVALPPAFPDIRCGARIQVVRTYCLPTKRSFGVLRYQARNQGEAAAQRLPVPAGRRFATRALSLREYAHGATKARRLVVGAPTHGQALRGSRIA